MVEDYQTTNHVPEALHRLTEIYLALGLTEEARKTASVLGHNFPGSPWYQDSYALLVEGAQPAEPDRAGPVPPRLERGVLTALRRGAAPPLNRTPRCSPPSPSATWC